MAALTAEELKVAMEAELQAAMPMAELQAAMLAAVPMAEL